jgi:hypothetical protein
MKPSREQRAAYKAAIEAVFTLFQTLDPGRAKDSAERACDELLAQRYGPISAAPAD